LLKADFFILRLHGDTIPKAVLNNFCMISHSLKIKCQNFIHNPLVFQKSQKILIKEAGRYSKLDTMSIIIPFAIETAMRRGEIALLTWEHIDLDYGTVFLPDTKNGEPRTVPLSPYAMQLLRQCGVKESGRPFPIPADSITQGRFQVQSAT